MKILWESFLFLSTPFVHLSIRAKRHRYAITFAVFILLFAQCISHDSIEIDEQQQNGIVNVTHNKKWINENTNAYAAASMASAVRVAISKRHSPTKISNSSSSNRMFSSRYRSIDAPTHSSYREKTHLFAHNKSSTSPPFNAVKLTTMSGEEQQPSSAPLITNALILIQTRNNIELNLVRDQFHQFSDMFGVKLANITIDFDTIDGKYVIFL